MLSNIVNYYTWNFTIPLLLLFIITTTNNAWKESAIGMFTGYSIIDFEKLFQQYDTDKMQKKKEKRKAKKKNRNGEKKEKSNERNKRREKI